MNTNINPTCILSREYVGRSGKRYRAEAWRDSTGEIVYTGYILTSTGWAKVPCSTRSQEARYPRKLAKLGAALVYSLTVPAYHQSQ